MLNKFMRRVRLLAASGCLMWSVTACGTPAAHPALPDPTALPPLPAPPSALVLEVNAETLPALVVAERQAAIAGDVAQLTTLWANDARIIDGRGSPQRNDDYVWAGRAAILDRYDLAVFPAPPPPLTLAELADATLTVEGDRATLLYAGDRWQFIRQEGRWWLHELVYSSP